MATIRVPVGTAHYGTIYHRKGGSSSTLFWFIAFFPLIPVGGERNLVDERGVVQSESRIYLPSLLLALFNSWGLVALLILFNRAYFESGHTMEKTGAALAMMVLLFGSWIWGGGLWRVPGMGRRTAIMAAVLGAIGVGTGALLVTETQKSLEYQAAHATDGMSQEQRLAAMSKGLKSLADAQKAAEQGDLDAACKAGDQVACVKAARALEATDQAKAQEIYQRACDANIGLGCSRLGFLYRYQTKPDLAKALSLMKRACDLADGYGCWHLGEMHKLGSGVPRDPVAGAAFTKRACELKYPAGCSVR
jgi:TPR repeat protein